MYINWICTCFDRNVVVYYLNRRLIDQSSTVPLFYFDYKLKQKSVKTKSFKHQIMSDASVQFFKHANCVVEQKQVLFVVCFI